MHFLNQLAHNDKFYKGMKKHIPTSYLMQENK